MASRISFALDAREFGYLTFYNDEDLTSESDSVTFTSSGRLPIVPDISDESTEPESLLIMQSFQKTAGSTISNSSPTSIHSGGSFSQSFQLSSILDELKISNDMGALSSQTALSFLEPSNSTSSMRTTASSSPTTPTKSHSSTPITSPVMVKQPPKSILKIDKRSESEFLSAMGLLNPASDTSVNSTKAAPKRVVWKEEIVDLVFYRRTQFLHASESTSSLSSMASSDDSQNVAQLSGQFPRRMDSALYLYSGEKHLDQNGSDSGYSPVEQCVSPNVGSHILQRGSSLKGRVVVQGTAIKRH